MMKVAVVLALLAMFALTSGQLHMCSHMGQMCSPGGMGGMGGIGGIGGIGGQRRCCAGLYCDVNGGMGGIGGIGGGIGGIGGGIGGIGGGIGGIGGGRSGICRTMYGK